MEHRSVIVDQIFARFKRRIAYASVICCVAAGIGGCTAATSPGSPQAALASGEGVASITATDPARVGRAAAAASALAREPSGRRPVERSGAPFLYGAPLGRAFLDAPSPKALARGEPGAFCPGAGLSAAPQAASAQDAAARALSDCLAEVAARGARDCGCRILAVNDSLAAPLTEFAYAPGVGARLIGAGAGLRGRPLVALERGASNPALVEVAFLDAAGPAAVAQLGDDGRARLLLLSDGAIYEGRREPRGWRRGRLTERLLLEGPDGRRLVALIGFEPADIAAEGFALGRWPATAPG